jgi:hypothetical protein
MTREDLLVVRQIHPKNKKLYVLVVDKVSFTVHLGLGPRKIRMPGVQFRFTEDEIKKLRDLRNSSEIQNDKTYSLTNFI